MDGDGDCGLRTRRVRDASLFCTPTRLHACHGMIQVVLVHLWECSCMPSLAERLCDRVRFYFEFFPFYGPSASVATAGAAADPTGPDARAGRADPTRRDAANESRDQTGSLQRARGERPAGDCRRAEAGACGGAVVTRSTTCARQSTTEDTRTEERSSFLARRQHLHFRSRPAAARSRARSVTCTCMYGMHVAIRWNPTRDGGRTALAYSRA